MEKINYTNNQLINFLLASNNSCKKLKIKLKKTRQNRNELRNKLNEIEERLSWISEKNDYSMWDNLNNECYIKDDAQRDLKRDILNIIYNTKIK